MITELSDKDILLQLRRYPSVLEFILKLTPSQRKALPTILDWDFGLLRKLWQEPDHLAAIHKMWDVTNDKPTFVDGYLSAVSCTSYNKFTMYDAFSDGQIRSKVWAVQKLKELDIPLGRVWILCGWIGVLAYMLLEHKDDLRIDHVRSFDIDPNCAETADKLNKWSLMNDWTFKASTMDVMTMTYENFTYETAKADRSMLSLTGAADTIINTSTDHLLDPAWYDAIPTYKLVVLQNNNFLEGHEHVNNVNSIDDLIGRYPMSQILYQGTLDFDSYTRYMIIGYK